MLVLENNYKNIRTSLEYESRFNQLNESGLFYNLNIEFR
jgi:hypothetical protein